MNQRRQALKLIVAGVAACAGTTAFAASDITVYFSPD